MKYIKKARVETLEEPNENGNFKYLFRKTNDTDQSIDEIYGIGNIKDKKKVR